MVYSKLTSLINTQKIKRKESKYTAIKNHQLTKKDSKRGKKDKGSTKKKSESKEENGDSNPLPVNNYPNYKWFKFSH